MPKQHKSPNWGDRSPMPEAHIVARSARAIIVNPYHDRGGAGEFQENLAEICQSVFGASSIVVCRVAGEGARGSRLMGYWVTLMRALRQSPALLGSDVVIIQGHYNPGSWVFGIGALRRGKRLIVIPHGDFVPLTGDGMVYRSRWTKQLSWRLFGSRLLRGATSIVVGSDLELDRYVKLGIPRTRLSVIPNPIALVEPVGSVPTPPTSAPFALWLGRISREKGLDLLIDAWRILSTRRRPITLKLVGRADDPAEYNRLQQRVRIHGLEGSIEFHQWADATVKGQLLASARCVLLPSFYESFGRVVPESIAARTPVIAATTTPWHSIEALGCSWIERKADLWAAAVERFGCGPEKILLDADDCAEFLDQFTFDKVRRHWQELLMTLR